jgi:hypothetical protein
MVLRSAGLELSVAGLETKDDIDGDLDNVAIQSVDAVEHVQETDGGAGILVLVGAVATARPAVAILANVVVGAGLELSAASLEAKDNIDGNLDNIAIEKVDAVKEVEETNGSALVLVLRGAVVALVPAATLVAVFVAAVAGLQAKDDVDRDLDNIAVENINTVENVQQTNGSASVLVLCRAVTALVPAVALLADIVAVGAAAELSGSGYDRADEGTHKGSSSEELHVERRGRIERR